MDLDKEDDIRWDELIDARWVQWTGDKLQQRWLSLKKTVPSPDATHRGVYMPLCDPCSSQLTHIRRGSTPYEPAIDLACLQEIIDLSVLVVAHVHQIIRVYTTSLARNSRTCAHFVFRGLRLGEGAVKVVGKRSEFLE